MELDKLITNLEFKNEQSNYQETIKKEIAKYYNDEITLNDLADELQLKKGKVRQQLPKIRLDCKCEVCKNYFLEIIPLKTELEKFEYSRSIINEKCEKCNHIQKNFKSCYCDFCSNIKQQCIDSTLKLTYAGFIDSSFENLINIFTLVQIKSLNFYNIEFCINNNEFVKFSNLLNYLHDQNIVLLSNTTDIKKLNWENNLKFTYSPTKVVLSINPSFIELIRTYQYINNRTLTETLLNIIRSNYEKELKKFISNLIIEELVDLFIFILTEVRKIKIYNNNGQLYKDKKEINRIFSELYKNFTPTQIYIMIYSTLTKEAASKNSKWGQYKYKNDSEISVNSILKNLLAYSVSNNEYINTHVYNLPNFNKGDSENRFIIEQIFKIEKWFFFSYDEVQEYLENFLSKNTLSEEKNFKISIEDIERYQLIKDMLFLQIKFTEEIILIADYSKLHNLTYLEDKFDLIINNCQIKKNTSSDLIVIEFCNKETFLRNLSICLDSNIPYQIESNNETFKDILSKFDE